MSSVKLILTVKQPGFESKEYIFDRRTRLVLGRAEDCDFQLPNDIGHTDISRHHCLLEIDPPAVRAQDLGSRNGTYVNDDKIGQRPIKQFAEEPLPGEYPVRELKDGDQLRMASTIVNIGIVSKDARTRTS
jgi:pSer/pThr/pTyr-binding forkhead associated (FHA) protein